MISHASKALLSKVVPKTVGSTARTLSSMSWPSAAHSAEFNFRPVSSLQEALYPSDLSSLPSDEGLDPRSYGYRVVYPATVSMDASLHDEDSEYLGSSNRTYESFLHDSQTTDNESYYNASFRPQVEGEGSIANLTAAEKAAIMDCHRDWDRQLLEEEIMRFVTAD